MSPMSPRKTAIWLAVFSIASIIDVFVHWYAMDHGENILDMLATIISAPLLIGVITMLLDAIDIIDATARRQKDSQHMEKRR